MKRMDILMRSSEPLYQNIHPEHLQKFKNMATNPEGYDHRATLLRTRDAPYPHLVRRRRARLRYASRIFATMVGSEPLARPRGSKSPSLTPPPS